MRRCSTPAFALARATDILVIPSFTQRYLHHHRCHQYSSFQPVTKNVFLKQTSYPSHSPTITNCATTPTPTPIPTSPATTDQQQQQRTVLDELKERGLFDAATADDETLRGLLSKRITVYTGFDPTADSLHLGNLLALIALKWFQKHNHTVIAVLGGATGKVGDPSGKSTERPILNDETIANNLKGIEENIKQILINENLHVLNNYDWVAPITFLDFLRDVGKHARVNNMLTKDSVKSRLQPNDNDDNISGMSFTEFTYQLLQAYDFMYLNDNYNVTFQLGGSDQWGNITAGTELTRKLRNGKSLYGITFPLLTTSDGKKFGKSESGAVWLNSNKLSPYEFYQFLFKTSDNDVFTFLKRLTFLPIPQIDQLEQQFQTNNNYTANTAQKLLAESVTKIVHGEDGLKSALAATAAAQPGSKAVLNSQALEAISNDMPCFKISKLDIMDMFVVDVMVRGGLQKSKGEARRLIKNGGAYMNNEKITDASMKTSESHLIDGRLILLGAGKKNKLLVRVE